MTTDPLQILERLAELQAKMPVEKWFSDNESWIEVNDISVYSENPDDPENPGFVANVGAPIARCDDVEEGRLSYDRGQFIAAARNAPFAALARQVREMREVISKLPHTADGQPAYPGMEVWFFTPRYWTKSGGGEWVEARVYCLKPSLGPTKISDGYTTEAAARDALAKLQEAP